jgi:cell division protease FtsH
MDGFRETENVVLIAATNREYILDDALVRSGRFDTKIKISLPNEEDRVGILAIHLKTVIFYFYN